MFIVFGLVGSLGLFLYGMQLTSESLQLATDYKLRNTLRVLTKNPPIAVIFGFLVTVIFNSSSVTTIMLVGLVSASLMTVSQTIGVLLGAGVGTAVTVQLLAFNLGDYSLLLVGIAAITIVASGKNSKWKHIGRALLGFGFLFYGMELMAETMYPLRSNLFFRDLLLSLEEQPIWGVLVATVFTGIVQSSAATIGLLLSLASQGMITIEAAIPLVLGANIGTSCSTAFLSALGTTGEAKQVGLINIVIKVLGALLFIPFIPLCSAGLKFTSASIGRQLANFHTLYNVLLVVIFLPFSNQLARLGAKLLPRGRAADQTVESAKFLNDSFLEVPDIAINQALLQTVEMGRITREEMLKHLLSTFTAYQEESIDRIKEAETVLDALYQKICAYVSKVSSTALSEDLAQRSVQILYIANDLEHIGDIIINGIDLARKFSQGRTDFSGEGMRELEIMYQKADTSLSWALEAFETADEDLATQVIKEHPKILRFENELRYNHFERIRRGNEKTIATSAIHLDLIEYLLRIENHAMNIAYVVLGMV
jgi:phosphate:Na+ symporter